MKLKSKLKNQFSTRKLNRIIIPIVASGMLFGNVAMAQSLNPADLLAQGINNFQKIQNYTYSAKVQNSSPLFDIDGDIGGKNSAYVMESHGNFSLNSWVFQKPYQFDYTVYLDIRDEKNPEMYVKFIPNDTLLELFKDTGISKEFDSKDFFKIDNISGRLLNPQNINNKETLKEFSIQNLKDNITNVKLISSNGENAKIAFTLNYKLIDPKIWNEQILNSIEDDNLKKTMMLRKMEYTPLFKVLYGKSYPIDIEVDISKKDKFIHHIRVDLSDTLEKILKDTDTTEVMKSYQLSDNVNLLSMLKNYVAQSIITFDIDLSNINSTDIKDIPKEVIDSSISKESLPNKEEMTSIPKDSSNLQSLKGEDSTQDTDSRQIKDEKLPFPEPMNLDSGIIGQMENYDKVTKELEKEAHSFQK